MFLTCIFGCSNDDEYIVDKKLNVVVESGEHFELSSNVYQVEENSSLEINMNIEAGYYINSLNYKDCEITINDSGASILLKNICYNVRLKPQICKYPSVHLVSNADYSTEKYDYILKEGNELDFDITINSERELNSCSYTDCDLFNLTDNLISVHLFNIRSDIEVNFSFEDKQYAEAPAGSDEKTKHMYSLMPKGKGNTKYIFYCLNDGQMIDNPDEEYGFFKKVDVTNHPRPNTDIGTTTFKRDGYQLEAWNTKKDGSGIRIGLGSRFTMEEYNTVLYAQWKRETPESIFKYKVANNAISIIGLNDNTNLPNELVIPNYINDYKVTNIKNGSFTNLKIDSLYLPLYLSSMDYYAFTDCSIGNVHFYDSLFFYDYSFERSTIKKVFINAVEKPRYCKSEISCFPDKIDKLILNHDKKKLILYGGCNLAYGICSNDLTKEFNEYNIFNMGVIGGTNSGFQLDCISKFVNEGDLVVHAPESMSPNQLMHINSAEPRMFNNLESNYDLLTLVDVTKISYFFNSYHDFSVYRQNLDPCKYEDYCDHYNEYGDILDDIEVEYNGEFLKRNEYGKINYNYEEKMSTKYETSFVNQTSVELLESYYKIFTDKGVDVVFSYSPVNEDSLGEEEIEKQSWLVFESKLKEFLTYPIISNVEDYIYPSEYFLDTNYHLNIYGAKLRTQQLISDLTDYFLKNKNISMSF